MKETPTTSSGSAGPVSVDALLGADPRAMAGVGRGEHLIALERAQARLDAARLETLAVFDAEVDGAVDGAPTTASWVAPRCGISQPAARERVKAARFLRHAPMVADALAAGRLTYAKVCLFARWVVSERHLQLFPDHEALLVDEASGLTVEQANQYLARWASLADPEHYDRTQGRTHAARRVFLNESWEGTGDLKGTLTAEATLIFGQALADLMDEMRRADLELPPEERRTTPQLRHDALVELARRAAAWKAASMPAAAPVVTVLLTWADLLRENGMTATGGPPVSAATARRLACDANISRLLVGPDSEPLDLGRTARLFSRAQRRALFARFGGCSTPGCPSKPNECDIHHTKWWLRDKGETNVNDGAPACRTRGCHDNIHNGTWTVTTDEHGTPTHRRRDGSIIEDPRRAMLDH